MKIRKTLLTALLVLAVLVVGVLYVDKYQKLSNQKAHDNQVAADQATARTKELQDRVTKAEAAYQHERVECEKGAVAHVQLITLSKTNKSPAPVCGPAVLQ